MDTNVRHEPDRHRFVTEEEARESHLLYAPAGQGRVDFRSTWVDPAVRGRGVGERLVRVAFDWARTAGLRVVPTCWFVGTVVRRHPEYQDLLV